jgi:GMP synthase PP-ATPase subunit
VPVQSVGVQGDDRTYRHALCLYAPSLETVLTGEQSESFWRTVPHFANATPEINRVVFCVSHAQPPVGRWCFICAVRWTCVYACLIHV